ncbi:unnamed protein product [Amaranthus hypochondriacus]
MFATRNFPKQSLKTLTYLFRNNHYTQRNHFPPNVEIYRKSSISESSSFHTSFSSFNLEFGFNGFRRSMSTSKGRSMRSKVERRMQREAGKTQRQIRQAKKIKLKLMTDEERLIYNLRRAKKKVALLLQKLKKYELPELPAPRHDPELLTPEQLQAYKKIGYRNKNYCEVGVRGVFGGVVQNMHLHWKFHETVQVCCDNFPKERIKEMATMLARLSGGIVVNIHNVKTIIMFRGRNYRQPKNLIPVNTLTKRKALFKARFEQALESQKLNIKKIEQQLRKKGISPDDPVAMASIQRVASTFFNAIDKKEGSPYVFRETQDSVKETQKSSEQPEFADDSDQEELDKFIAEIEEAVDQEWAEEEAAEKEEYGKIKYRNKEDSGGRFKPERYIDDMSGDEDRGRRQGRGSIDAHKRQTMKDSEDEDYIDDYSGSEGENNTNNLDERHTRRPPRATRYESHNRRESVGSAKSNRPDDPEIDSDDSDEGGWNSNVRDRTRKQNKRGRSDIMETINFGGESSDADIDYSDAEIPLYESDDDTLESNALKAADEDYIGSVGPPHFDEKEEDSATTRRNQPSRKYNDEVWDSD